MKSVVRSLVALVMVAALGTPAMATPSIGDSPPPLKISEWVKGRPVDLKRDVGKKIYMVEFWATWCPPCKMSVPRLTQFQKRFEKDLTIIGVTSIDDRGNDRRAIKRFVKDQGSAMDYAVAIDDGMTTWNAYMGMMAGIPHAFVVDRDGKIVWQGSPLEPALDQVLADVIAGSYDIKSALRGEEVSKRFEAVNLALQIGQWSVVWDLSVGILKLEPSNETAMQYLLGMYLERYKDGDAFRSWARSHIAANRNDAQAMQRLAMILCANPYMAKRTPDLALEAGKAAYEASKGREPAALAAYAEALYQIGKLDQAIQLQQEAIAVAPDPGAREELQDVLDYYNLCKQLQTSER